MEELQPQTEPAKRPGLLVLFAGMGTAMGTLALLYVVDVALEFHALGFYINGVIPLGAIGVGLLAGSGYGIASWLTGARIGRELLITVILFQVVAYGFAQYAEYLMVREAIPGGAQIAFWEYFDAVTRAFA